MLAIVARRLEAQVRTVDTTARFGGDEFVIVADDLAGDELPTWSQRLRDAVAAPIDIGGITVDLAVTVGTWSRSPAAPSETADGLIAAADVDMYLRKPGAQRQLSPTPSGQARDRQVLEPGADPALHQDRQVRRHGGRRQLVERLVDQAVEVLHRPPRRISRGRTDSTTSRRSTSGSACRSMAMTACKHRAARRAR